MIDFKELIIEQYGSVAAFSRATGLVKHRVEWLATDYRAFYSLRQKEVRVIANALGFYYTNLLYQVEETMMFKGLMDVLEKWDGKIQKRLEKDDLIEEYQPLVYRYAKHISRYRWNQDIQRTVVIASRVHAIQKKANPEYEKGNCYALSRLIGQSELIRLMLDKAKDKPDYFMKIVCEISEGAEFRLNILDLARTTYNYINTL